MRGSCLLGVCCYHHTSVMIRLTRLVFQRLMISIRPYYRRHGWSTKESESEGGEGKIAHTQLVELEMDIEMVMMMMAERKMRLDANKNDGHMHRSRATDC